MRIDFIKHVPRGGLALTALMTVALTGVVGGAGCAVDSEDTDPSRETDTADTADTADTENVGSTTQAFSWGTLTRLNRSHNLPTSANRVDLGTSTGVTCFLAGVGGNLSSSGGAPGTVPGHTLYTTANVDVYTADGRWWLQVRSGTGHGARLSGVAMCVNSIAGQTAEKSWSGGSRVELATATSARRCYLTRVSNQDPYYTDNNFSASTDEVRVWSDGAKWWIGGSGNAHGSARCINVNGSYNYGGLVGNATMELGYNGGDVQCALTSVGGRFRTNSYDSGVFITYNAGLGRYYMSSTSGKSVTGQCFW
ncbi:MAG: hypothetical protein KIS78_03890 [Labilithrix sp.]|nr:hypothetical protein [Labilithrix sp.]